MYEHWESLVANFAIVALVISTWVNGQFAFAGRKRIWRHLAFGVAMGLGAVGSMLFAIQIDNSLFDLRSSLLAVAGFFGGPVAAAVAVLIAASYRFGVVGGPSGGTALIGIVLAALTGIAVSRLTRGRFPALVNGALLALAVPAVSLILGVAIRAITAGGLAPLSISIAFMNMAATAISAFYIMRYRVLERERDLFRTAFEQSPDFQYVKNAKLQFAAVNLMVAHHNGFTKPAEMVGKTDFDLVPAERAKALMLSEQKVIQNGEPLIDHEEMIEGLDEEPIWYLTSKVPIKDADGEIIGLAGVTHDITVEKRMRHEISESRNLLNYVLSEISDGIAMYDRQGTLAYCNDQFSQIFPLTSAVRRRGQHIRDILQAVVETGEQKGIPAGQEARWIDDVAQTLMTAGGRAIELFDGRWLQIRSRPTTDGSSLVVVTDITAAKQAEASLLSMTEQLRLLAATDGLTGLSNRRAFDQALENEISRSRRGNQPLSLLLVDVDRFKAYNDFYGHQAGDEVLKLIAGCLRGALKRPADVAARYGGEEFAAILPETDEDGAMFIADQFREAVRAMKVAHARGDLHIVTASVGVAVLLPAADRTADVATLIRRADEALYEAKESGRDRAVSWHPQDRRRSAGGRA